MLNAPNSSLSSHLSPLKLPLLTPPSFSPGSLLFLSSPSSLPSLLLHARRLQQAGVPVRLLTRRQAREEEPLLALPPPSPLSGNECGEDDIVALLSEADSQIDARAVVDLLLEVRGGEALIF